MQFRKFFPNAPIFHDTELVVFLITNVVQENVGKW